MMQLTASVRRQRAPVKFRACVRQRVRQLQNRGNRYREQGQYPRAESLLQRALMRAERSLGSDDLAVAGILNDLGVLYKYDGRYDEAEPLYWRALALVKQLRGPNHPNVASVYHNLGGLAHARGSYAEGEPFARLAVVIHEQALGSEHPDVAADKAALAALLDGQGKFDEGEALYWQAIAYFERENGSDNYELSFSFNNLAAIAHARGNYPEAEQLYGRALTIKEQAVGPDHPDVGMTLNNLAVCYQSQGRSDEAAVLYHRALAIFAARLDPAHPDAILCRENYELLLRVLGQEVEVPSLESDQHTLDDDVKLYFALNGALFDASIAAWDAKRAYDCIRPISAIRTAYADQLIDAWDGPNRGTQRIRGGVWQPYQSATFVTPPFPEYVSAHSTFSAAAAAVLTSFTGSSHFYDGYALRSDDQSHNGQPQYVGEHVVQPGSSMIEDGPSIPIVLRWATFEAAANEAGLSRRFGGIHFQDGDLQGRTMGKRIGASACQYAEQFWRAANTDQNS